MMRRLLFVIFTLLASSFNSSAVNIDDTTKEFVQFVIETQNNHGGCILNELSRVIPRGEQIRAKLGRCPEAFIVLWEPLVYFPHLSLTCPSCFEVGVKECLHPIRWKDGRTTNDRPRFLYGLSNNALLTYGHKFTAIR